MGTFPYTVIDTDSKVVHVLSLVDVEASLVLLKGDGVSFHGTNHHLIAHHIVVHDVLKCWFKGLLINEVEVDELICGNLNPHIASDEIDESSYIDRVVQLPFHDFNIFIVHLFEE